MKYVIWTQFFIYKVVNPKGSCDSKISCFGRRHRRHQNLVNYDVTTPWELQTAITPPKIVRFSKFFQHFVTLSLNFPTRYHTRAFDFFLKIRFLAAYRRKVTPVTPEKNFSRKCRRTNSRKSHQKWHSYILRFRRSTIKYTPAGRFDPPSLSRVKHD